MEFANFFFGDEISSVGNRKLNWVIDYDNKETFTGKPGEKSRPGRTIPTKGMISIYLQSNLLNDPKKLYIVIGHELVHANDLDDGNYSKWAKLYPLQVNIIFEYRAYLWSAQAEAGFGINLGQQTKLNELATQLPAGFLNR